MLEGDVSEFHLCSSFDRPFLPSLLTLRRQALNIELFLRNERQDYPINESITTGLDTSSVHKFLIRTRHVPSPLRKLHSDLLQCLPVLHEVQFQTN